MCTLALLHRVRSDLPLLIAANRDELYQRPAVPPLLSSPPPLFGPRDLSAGGTWLAANSYGLLLGLTNRPPRSLPDPSLPPAEWIPPPASPRSRGEVIPLLLSQCRTVAEVEDAAAHLPTGAWNSFFLLAADGKNALSFAYHGRVHALTRLSPGLHVLENRPVDDPHSTKVSRVRERLMGAETWDRDQVPRILFAALADHHLPHTLEASRPAPLHALCVHTPVYGTRSGQVIGRGPSDSLWWHSEGPPCVTAPADFSEEFSGLMEGRA